jgi:hypothetical protein
MERSRLSAGVLMLAIAAGACAPYFKSERLPDGTYHLTCKTKLPVCLNASEVCEGKGYAVVRAINHYEHRGGTFEYVEIVASEAIVRCGYEGTLDGTVTKPEEPKCPIVAPAAPTRACVPGSSQACVGPSGCAGGQVCRPDGSAFGVCDCGGPAAAPAAQ